ncbi:hypothetical protein GCM10010160_10420 [Acrocarpospora corrugata]
MDTLLTVPTAPPAAGPDRALDPPPPDREPPLGGASCPAAGEEDVAAVEGGVAVTEGDVAQPAESPITADISAAASLRENMETTSSVRWEHTQPRKSRFGFPKERMKDSCIRDGPPLGSLSPGARGSNNISAPCATR